MTRAARLIEAVRLGLERVAGAALVALVGALVAVTFGQVVLRYGFNAPLRWSEEAARYLFVWIAFLGLFLAHRRGAHLGLDLAPHVLRGRARAALRLLAEAVVLFTLATAVATSGRLLEVSAGQASPVLGLPMIYVYGAFLAGAVLVSADIALGWLERALSKPWGDAA